MSIENDIKQNKFKNPYQRLGINLIYTGNWMMHQQLEMMRSYDLTPQQYNVLRILRGHHPEPMKVNAIAERMLDKTSNTSRLVDKLLLKEFLVRRVCPSDRRAVDVLITEKGLDLLKEMDPLIAEWEKNLHSITAEEAVHLSELLDKLRMSE
ncbi:MarR family winged helix-turn-helix transcriptional regulator [Salmonirosea aquatica]|uniref:MarR family transcriptional regulator n=1 Tax=Salmonirosea aquatica TaxID=2654236 RepID=A0A7C9BD51_9BACT|nr:MarR family transcriptional regulator [Cytophagaceae bacterium SJW1-29]